MAWRAGPVMARVALFQMGSDQTKLRGNLSDDRPGERADEVGSGWGSDPAQTGKRSAIGTANPGMTGSAVRVSFTPNTVADWPARCAVTVRAMGSATHT